MSEASVVDMSRPIWRDYLELTKPKVIALMILTSAIGMFLAVPGWVPWDILIFGNLGIALCGGAAATVNHVVDRHIDTKMIRTLGRPVAGGRIEPWQAITFAVIATLLGMTMLFVWTNPLAAWLTLASSVGYAFVYTMYLKRATPQNIVIGGLAGAAPPLLGWVAVTGEMSGHGLLLALIIFAWTPPHFWALAIDRKNDYAKAEIPMLPVTHGVEYTKLHIMLYTLILLAVTILPFATGMSGWLYFAGAMILNVGFIYWAFVMILGKKADASMKTFRYSITYLMLLFLVLLLDHYLVTPAITLKGV
jgi:protoheme IX farnesyltransferase